MRVAITGADGYLGRALVAALAADPAVGELIAIDSRPPRDLPPGTRGVQRDVRDPEIGNDLTGADAVVHLAARVLGRGSGARQVNVEGSRNVFGAAIRCEVKTIVHASSAAVYGSAPDSALPFTESSPLRPLPAFYYPQTKIAAERLLDEVEAARPGLRVVRMRPVATIGPGAPEIAGGRVFITPSDFDPLMQFTWIDDLVSAFRLALLDQDARGPFNVGAPGPVRASAVAGLIGARAVRAPFRLLRSTSAVATALRAPGAMHPGWVETARYPIVVATERAEAELGWSARLDGETALRRYGEDKRAEQSGGTARPAPLASEEGR